jgi:hypothetical protein
MIPAGRGIDSGLVTRRAVLAADQTTSPAAVACGQS